MFKRTNVRHLLGGLVLTSLSKTIVEIGVANGNTTGLLCKNSLKNRGHVWGFDMWSKSGLKKQFKRFGTLEGVQKSLELQGLNNFTLTKIDTRDKSFQNLLKKMCPIIDFAFIDACHSYSGTKGDFDAVYPLLSEFGMIAFHDTTLTDGSREFVFDLRTKFFDGTYDVVDIPFGPVQAGGGLSLLVKRSYYTIETKILQKCNIDDNCEEIYKKEKEWYLSELLKNGETIRQNVKRRIR